MAMSTLPLSKGRLTVEDLNDIADDGRFYELSYGSLIVTPAPNTRHQRFLVTVVSFLHQRAPVSLAVLGEAELVIRDDLVKRPDAMVVAADQVGGQRILGVPLLVVEILSPSTRALDLGEKRLVYAEAGIPAYWLVDPDAETVTILELEGQAYVDRAVIDSDAEWKASLPFPMTVQGAAIFASPARPPG